MSYNYDGLVIKALSDVMRSQLTTFFGIADSDLSISRSYQPTKQLSGARSGSKKYQIFITPVAGGAAVGSGFDDELSDDETQVERSYRTIRPVTYQIECLANFDIADDESLEGMDLAQMTREMLDQLDTIEQLTEIGIFMESATMVRPSFSVNNESQFESSPSFDLVLTYNSVYVKGRDMVTSVNETMERV